MGLYDEPGVYSGDVDLDPPTSRAVESLLEVAYHVLRSNDSALKKRGTGLEQEEPLRGSDTPTRRTKLTWALRGKVDRKEQVQVFATVVQKLHDLVPRRKSRDLRSGKMVVERKTNQALDTKSQSKVLIDIKQMIAEIIAAREVMKPETRRAIFAWVLGSIADNGKYQDSIQEKLEGTCSWILNRPSFLQWLSPSSDSKKPKLLWIHGHAGFGKTILCAYIVEYLLTKSKGQVAHFFWSSEFAREEDPYIVLRSWVSQLIKDNEGAFELAFDKWQNSEYQAAPKVAITQLLQEVLRSIPGCTLVVDGLDECAGLSDGSVAKMMQDLRENISETTRVLIVSRDEPEIRRALVNDSYNDVEEIKLSVQDVEDDTAALSRDIVDRKIPAKPEEFRNNLSVQMAERCGGQFLWLKMQAAALRRGKNKKQLQQAIEETPTELHAIYERNWKRIEGLADRDRALALLRWAAFSVRPLTVGEITEAVLIDEDAEEFPTDDLPDDIDVDYVETEIHELCSPLLELRQPAAEDEMSMSDWTVHLAHFTVKEYLILSLPNTELMSNTHLQKGYERLQSDRLARLCLRYITYSDTWGDSLTPNPFFQHSLRDYAAGSWYVHLKPASGSSDLDSETLKLVLNFMDEANPVWECWRSWFDKHLEDYTLEMEEETCPPGPVYYAVKFQLDPIIMSQIQSKGNAIVRSNQGRTALHLACILGNQPAVEAILDAGVDIDLPGVEQRTPLYSAAKVGREEVTKLLLDRDADVHAKSTHGWTPLHTAVHAGSASIVELLIGRGAESDINAGTNTQLRPLSIAAEDQNIEVLRLLLKHGADANEVDIDNWTALQFSVLKGCFEAVVLLLQHGADPRIASVKGFTPLHRAANTGNLDITKLLLAHKDKEVYINSTTEGGWTPLGYAAGEGATEIVELLIKNGADPGIASANGITPLQEASESGYLEIAQLLLANSQDDYVNTIDVDGWTAVFLAAWSGHTEVVELLLQNGADANMTTNEGIIALHVAAKNGHIKTVRMLLEGERRAHINLVDKIGWTALHFACEEGQTEVAELLIELGADPTVTSFKGVSALHTAARVGDVRITQLILEKWRNRLIDAVDENGWTPLCYAIMWDQVGVADLLLKNGADPNISSDQGVLPLHLASGWGSIELVAKLLEKAPAVSVVENDGWQAIHRASNTGQTEIVKLLLEKGANVMAKGEDDSTPLHLASWGGHVETVKTLLDNGADLFSLEKDLRTSLHEAAYRGHIEVVRLLLERGANVMASNIANCTPLHSAVFKGQIEVARLLLQKGASHSAVDNAGYTALHLAAKKGHHEIARLLLEHEVAAGKNVPLGKEPGESSPKEEYHGEHLKSVVNQGDLCGRSPLYLAARYGYIEVAKVLLGDRRVHVTSKDYLGTTALSAAVRNGHLPIAECLLSAGHLMSASPGTLGLSIMGWAYLASNHSEMVSMLQRFAEERAISFPDEKELIKRIKPAPSFHRLQDWCDSCTLTIEVGEKLYLCASCVDFLLCTDCFDHGYRCPYSTHSYEEGISEKED